MAVTEPAATMPLLDEAPDGHPTAAAAFDHATAPPHEPAAEPSAADPPSALGEAPGGHPTAAADPADVEQVTTPPHEPVAASPAADPAPPPGVAPADHPTASADPTDVEQVTAPPHEPAAELPAADPAPRLGDAPAGLDHDIAPNAPDAEPLPPEATAETLIEAARQALQADDAAAAILLLRDAAALFPQVAHVHQELARAAESVADWPLAEQAWRDFLRLVTTDGTAYAGLAAALRAQGRAGDAEAVLGDGMVAVPDDASLAIDHVRMAEQRGDWPAAAERWRALAELRPDLPEGPFGHAVALQRLGAGDAAEAVLVDLVQRFPDHAAALHDLARLAELRQDWAAAERSWRAFNAVHADIWWSHSALIGAVRQQGRLADAEALLRQAMLRFPDDPNLLADHARHAESSDDWPEALRRWEEVIARFPDVWTGYGGKITALSRMGRQYAADQALLAYAPLLPDDAGALHDLARHAERHQDWPAAEAAWRGFLRQNSRMDWAWLGVVQALAQQDRRAAAAEVLADAMVQVPGSLLLTLEAARLSDARGRHAEALDHWREVARLSPTAPDGPIGEANALSRQGDAAGADAVIEAAIARLPDQPALYEAHAELAVMRGDWQTALARLQVGQQRFPAEPRFAARISEIEARLAAQADSDREGAHAPDAEADQIGAMVQTPSAQAAR